MNTKKEDYNNDKLYFKLYEYISRIDKFPSNDINLQNEKKKRKYINKQKKKDEYKNLNHETVSNFNKNVVNAKGTDDNTFKEKNEHIIIRNDNINYDNQNTYGYNQDCDEYKDYLSNDSLSAYSSFDEEENEIDSYITENEQSEIDQRNKEDRKNNNLPITLSDQKEIKDNHLHKNNITDNILHNLSEEKSSFHISSNNEPTNDFYNNRENKEILEKKEKNNICQYKFKDIEKNNNMDIFMEIENYYFIYKMNRKIEEYNSVNEMKIIKSERNEKLSEMFKKIHSILTHYKEIKIELKNLIKNKQLIYKNFYSIFLHYYYRYSEVKMIKLNKSKIEKRLKYYTNIERFEMILDKMEKNVYAYFIDIYKTSMIKNRQVGKNQECAVSHEEEEEYTSDNEETDEDLIDEMDEDGDYDEAYDNINDNINNNGDDNIYDNINNNMDDDIYDNIYDNIYDSMYDNIYDSMYDDVDDNIYDNIANNTDNNNDNIMPGNINKHINNIIDNHINDHSKEETHDDISQETQQKIDLSLTNEKKKKTSKISDTNKKNVTKTKNQTKDKKKNSFFCINKSTLENNEYACSSHPLNEHFLKNMECNFLNNIDDDNFKREIYKKLLNKNKIDKNNEKRKKKRHINNKLNEKNEIHSMLHFSEKAIKFFKKNNTYFNAKGKILKYQSIIKRILKYIINLFRDVLNNTDLNINMTKEDRGQYLYDMQYENRRTDGINDTINRNSLKSQNKNINNNDIMSCDEYINRNWGKSPIRNNEIKLFCYTQNENYSINQTGNKKENALFEENIENEEKMTENFITYEDIKKSNIYENNINDNNIYKISTINNLIKNHFLLQTNDEKEIDKIYNNVNIIYFNKYIDEFEYYKKYKIKCYCMKDIINFIYKKSLNDENNLYIDDYNSLESIYVSTRLKILNNNILKNFEYFFDKDICKYIKNVCLLAIYISKLESDLFLHIFNNNLNSSINIILNSIGVCIYDNINEKIYELNNMKIIRKIIQIIYVDIIDIYTDDSYNIIHDYLKRICTTLKERLLYIIEMYISYYTKNVNYNSTIPYMCFQSIKKKFTNIINGFLYEDYIGSSNYEIINHETKKNKDKRLNDPQDNFHDQNIHSDHINHIEKKIDNISSGNIYNSNDKYMEISENDDYSSESIESENNYKEHEYNINILNENNVYKSFSFNNIQFNKDTIFSLRGIDMNIIGTILILKTINFIIEENTFIDLFKECLENTFNSITHVYKQYIKKHDDMFNSNIFLIKNLSFLLYLFYKVTNDNEFLNTYLHKDLIDHLLFNVTHKESKKNDQKYKTGKDNNNNNNNEITGVENEISIFNFIKRVYTVSSNTDVQNKILNMFNESLYNFIITTISKVCAPLINILSNEYNDYENENDIKEVLYNWINGKKKEKEKEEEHNKDNSRKDLFSFLKDLDFEQLKEYTKNINEKKNQELSNKNMDDIKNELQSFRQKIYFLFPKIYFYIKLFICSNTDRYSENNFFYVLFDYIIGVLKYKIIYMLSEVYFLLGCKYSKKISNIFEENYINDIFLFLNSNEQYSCVFSDIHQYYDMKKNYNFL